MSDGGAVAVVGYFDGGAAFDSGVDTSDGWDAFVWMLDP